MTAAARSGELPVVTIGGRQWLVDERLNELRAADNPHDRLTRAEAVYLLRLQARARCKAKDVDYTRCERPGGHDELHFRRCAGCSGGHHWPRPEELGERGDHAQALLEDAARSRGDEPAEEPAGDNE